ncbi:hypothetical protein LTR09_003872 [Extremus antarcticus]|uniref:SAP domain-containing protein n=1 Tax=Extremus antarcticus TaxID=702011 RepID=A0AAJ0GE09_9PEZI|nr:hypothetical protein LTR09_003872 [Extremus antarcticus]
MAAPRATQFIALRNLSRGAQQVRHLSMTGPATYASPMLAQERPITNLPRDVAGLRAECQRRKIETAGSKQDLLSRLQADELSQSRAFSTRPTPSTPSPSPARHFNASRTLKATHDTSTIDFCYLPQSALDPLETEETFRVPILPDSTAMSMASAAEEEAAPVMKAEISTMSADAVFLPMSELSDGHANDFDFHGMADKLAAGLRRVDLSKVGVEEQASMAKKIFGDMIDDVLKAVAGGAKGRA